MSVASKISTLKSEISKGMAVLLKIHNFYDYYVTQRFQPEKKNLEQAIVISDLVCSYYTCLETIFLRISQFFENDLAQERWHQDLLRKMTLKIDGVRDAVINNETYLNLVELLKFRHFKRYYFELEYDWDKLDFIQKKFNQTEAKVKIDLAEFLLFLENLEQQL